MRLEFLLSFGCTEGTCGVCEITILEGIKNLSKVTDEEKEILITRRFGRGNATRVPS